LASFPLARVNCNRNVTVDVIVPKIRFFQTVRVLYTPNRGR
jgi:hypothetical protein